MRTIHTVLGGLLLLCLAGASEAQRVGQIRGVGGLGCGEYLEHRAKNQDAQVNLYVAWTWGFLSSYNMFASHRQVDVPDGPTVLAYADKHCRDNPLGNFAGAAISLIGDTGGWKAAPSKK